MKTTLRSLLVTLSVLLMLPLSARALIYATETNYTVTAGQKVTLDIEAEGGEDLSWTTSDKKIATVKDGVVTAVKGGTVEITAEATDGSDRVVFTVTVEDRVDSLSFPKRAVDLYLGAEGKNSVAYAVEIKPETAGCKEVIYTTSSSAVATVDEYGTITAVGVGRCTITATSRENTSKPRTATCSVTVRQAVTEIELDRTSIQAEYGYHYTLTATAYPTDAYNRKLSWSSTDKSVATVKNSGKVTIVGYGTCDILVTANDTGVTQAVCHIVVPSYFVPTIYEGGGVLDELELFSEEDRATLAKGLTNLRNEYYGDDTAGPDIVIYTCRADDENTLSASTEAAAKAFREKLDTEYNLRNNTKKGMSGPIVITINLWQTEGRADVQIDYTSSSMRNKLTTTRIKEARSTMVTGFQYRGSYVEGILDWADYLFSVLTGASGN